MKMKSLLAAFVTLAFAAFILTGCSAKSSTDNKAQSSSSSSEAKSSLMEKTGTFTGKNDMKVSGTVTVSGSKIMLDNFATDEGPDLHIYLAKDGDVKGSGILDQKIDLKSAKQSFTIPEGTDLSKYNTVVIWCDKAQVAFGEAAIS
jgi:maltose-binding protein MalE